MLLHQSDLAALARCPAQMGYRKAGLPSKTNSAAAYGSVMHHSIQVLERHLHEARQKPPTEFASAYQSAVKSALETFVHYWNPLNIEAICDPVPNDGWLPRQGYSEMRTRGIDAIKKYADLIRYDDHELLATEYGFIVPIEGTWDDDLQEPHFLAGSVDRLALRHYLRNLSVCIDDYKTGKDYKYLRHNMQFSAYCYASTQREFWVGFDGLVSGHRMVEDGFGEERGNELFTRLAECGRRGTWINMRTFKFQDAGWRGPRDYARLCLAVEQFAAMYKADIFPLTIYGEVCQYCDYRSICGGTGLPDDDHGKPGK